MRPENKGIRAAGCSPSQPRCVLGAGGALLVSVGSGLTAASCCTKSCSSSNSETMSGVRRLAAFRREYCFWATLRTVATSLGQRGGQCQINGSGQPLRFQSISQLGPPEQEGVHRGRTHVSVWLWDKHCGRWFGFFIPSCRSACWVGLLGGISSGTWNNIPKRSLI